MLLLGVCNIATDPLKVKFEALIPVLAGRREAQFLRQGPNES